MKHLSYTTTRIACYIGYITQAITINLAPIFFIIFQNAYNISYSRLASLVLITFVIQLCVDFLFIWLMDFLGFRRSAVLAHIFATAGLVLLGILPPLFSAPYYGILIAVFLYSIGGGMTEVIISPLIDALPSDAKASSMSLLHSFYAWGQCLVVLLSTLILSRIGQNAWTYIPIGWALIPFFNIFLFSVAPMPQAEQTKKTQSRVGDLFRSGSFYVFILLMICSGASEQAMAQWASLFAERALGVSKIVGDILGPCLFALFMAFGRTLYGVFGQKIRMAPALLACALLSVVCYGLSVFSVVPVLALVGCALCGLGASLMWPGVLSMSSERHPSGGVPMFAILALGGDLGCSLGPWISGIVSEMTNDGVLTAFPGVVGTPDQLAMKNGMLIAAVFPLVMAVLLLFFLRSSHRREPAQSLKM